jgi:hypothetical protein
MNEQLEIKPRARRTDPETSHAAAASVENITRTQLVILRIMDVFGPLTDGAIHFMYDSTGDRPPVSDSGLRSRRAELVALGCVMDSGERVRLASGRMSIAWELTEKGMRLCRGSRSSSA